MPRPKLQPTEEQSRQVKMLSALGIPQEEIAKRIGIRSPKTLRKHFREQLDNGALEANSNVAKTLYQMATSGEHPSATIFWLKARMGWKDRPAFERSTTAPPPFVVTQEVGGQLHA